METRDYYPFGLRMPGRSVTAGTPAEDYTGHELDAETGMHYAGARYYMCALGRWTSTDPILREQSPGKLMEDGKSRYLSASPYNYTFNNPTNLTDPNGKEACCFLIPPLGLAEMPDNVATMAGNKEAQARVAKREGIRLGVASLFLPGPEDVLLGAAAATKAGRAIAKYGDEAVGFVKGLFRGGDEAIANSAKSVDDLRGIAKKIDPSGNVENIELDVGTAEDVARSLSGKNLKTSKDGTFYLENVTVDGTTYRRMNVYDGGHGPTVHLQSPDGNDINIRTLNLQ